MIRKLSILLLAVLTIVTAGCAKKTAFKQKPIKSLKERKVDFQETKRDVTLRAKIITSTECKEIFEDRASRLKGITPIQISLENNSDAVWHLLEKNIALKRIKTTDIMHHLTSSNFPLILSAIALGVGVLLVAPLFLLPIILCISSKTLALLLMPFFYPALLLGVEGGVALALCGALMVLPGAPLTFFITRAVEQNNQSELSEYLEETSLGKSIVIAPRKTIDLLIFVRDKNVKENFELKLLNDTLEETLPFTIQLPKKS